MNPTAPRVSVVLPVYNGGRFLAPAVESVLRQTFRDFELVAVDDGSVDDTLTTLRRYERSDPRVRVITQPNAGIVGALSTGLAAARGELIARMDGDDLCLPTRLARQLAHLDAHPDTVLLGGNVMVMDEEDDDVAPLKDLKFTHQEIDASLLACGWPLVHPAVMMRAAALRRVGGYRAGTFPHEDHDLFLRLAEVGRLSALTEVVLRYRRHSGSVSWNSDSRDHLAGIVAEARARRGLDPILPTTPPTQAHIDTHARPKQLRSWAWQALAAGNLSTARKYAFRTVRAGLIERETIKLIACCVRGR
jgi:glycosyltransferase involved in cell wall biosynthesis